MHVYNVEFQNQFFKIKTEHDDKVFKTLKLDLDKKLQGIQKNYKRISFEKAIFLVCLQLIEDKHFLKQTIDKNINKLESQAKSLLDDLTTAPQGVNFEIN